VKVVEAKKEGCAFEEGESQAARTLEKGRKGSWPSIRYKGGEAFTWESLKNGVHEEEKGKTSAKKGIPPEERCPRTLFPIRRGTRNSRVQASEETLEEKREGRFLLRIEIHRFPKGEVR